MKPQRSKDSKRRTSTGSVLNQNGTQSKLSTYSGITKFHPVNLKISKPPTPITDHAKIQTKWIPIGTDNLFFTECAEAIRLSTTAKAVVAAKAAYFVGGGLQGDERAVEYLNSICPLGLNINELAYRLFVDWDTFGNIVVLRCMDEQLQKATIYHKDVTTFRLAKHDEKGNITHAMFHHTWGNAVQQSQIKTVAIYPNNTKFEVDGVVTHEQVLIDRDYEPGSPDYGMPNWLGAKYEMTSEYLRTLYNVSELENGMHLAGVLVLKKALGEPSQNENYDTSGGMSTPHNSFKDVLTRKGIGTSEGNAGSVAIMEVDGVQSVADSIDFVSIPSTKDGSYLNAQEATVGAIITALHWYRPLAGIERQGALGDTTAMRAAKYLADGDADRARTRLINNIFRKLLPFELQESELYFADAATVTEADDIKLETILTKDELRELKGYKPSPVKEQLTALNGAQITSLVQVLAEPSLTSTQKAAVLQMSFGFADEQILKLFPDLNKKA